MRDERWISTAAQTSQIAAQPDHLIGRKRGQQLIQGLGLLLVKRAVIGSEGKSTHQFGPGGRNITTLVVAMARNASSCLPGIIPKHPHRRYTKVQPLRPPRANHH